MPLEIRSPSSFGLVFDDTNGVATGVALANLAAFPENITARIFDEAGVLLQSAAINRAGRGHTSFLFPDNFAAAVNRRGMVEHVVPQGGKISAVGLGAKAHLHSWLDSQLGVQNVRSHNRHSACRTTPGRERLLAAQGAFQIRSEFAE